MQEYDVNVRDVNELKNQASEILQLVQDIQNVNSELSDMKQKIGLAWEGNGDDRLSYLTTLGNNINNINYLNSAIDQLARELNNHADRLIAQSNRV